MSIPATMLKGKELANNWSVVDFHKKPPSGTGGFFSVCYIVENTKTQQRAFLKALDFSSAMGKPDSLTELQSLLNAYLFERDLLIKCKDRKLNKVSLPIDHGSVKVPGFSEFGHVHYIIFELAQGDIRYMLDEQVNDFDALCRLRTLHNAATGLKQLHWNEISHQDLKPSNILVHTKTDSKISDLGRASDKNAPFTYDQYKFSGDQSYAPIDIRYEIGDLDKFEYKKMTDLYLLGNLIFFLFSGANISNLILSNLDHEQIDSLGVSSFSSVLPYIEDAFAVSLESFKIDLDSTCPQISNEMLELIKQLCHPDPIKRAKYNSNNQSTVNSLEKVISKLDYAINKLRFTK